MWHAPLQPHRAGAADAAVCADAGNCTVYEWRTGTEPTAVERPHLEEPPEQVEEDAVRQAEGEPLPPLETLFSPSPVPLELRVQREERCSCERDQVAGPRRPYSFFLAFLRPRWVDEC